MKQYWFAIDEARKWDYSAEFSVPDIPPRGLLDHPFA
jgi:hypothetical protein